MQTAQKHETALAEETAGPVALQAYVQQTQAVVLIGPRPDRLTAGCSGGRGLVHTHTQRLVIGPTTICRR